MWPVNKFNLEKRSDSKRVGNSIDIFYTSIHKKGDKQICVNYGVITLLNITYEGLAKCILSKIKPSA